MSLNGNDTDSTDIRGTLINIKSKHAEVLGFLLHFYGMLNR